MIFRGSKNSNQTTSSFVVRRMSRFTAGVVVSMLLLASQATATNDMRPLGLVVMSQACGFQNPDFRDGLFSRTLGRSWTAEVWSKADEGAFPKCLRQKQWIPDALCKSLNALDVEDQEAL